MGGWPDNRLNMVGDGERGARQVISADPVLADLGTQVGSISLANICRGGHEWLLKAWSVHVSRPPAGNWACHS
ncbi:hypothetical protein GCM10022226_45460 [Sphaerisporangium flaviroseum]|uniref:Uncharacterized protein n=1 Tax=Sphaerisporangium flaviroseum TaxID=509199 RepID=A0ABP7IJE0_9ACTN